MYHIYMRLKYETEWYLCAEVKSAREALEHVIDIAQGGHASAKVRWEVQ